MLRELIHLARHAPATLALQRKLDQVDLYETLMARADDAGFSERRAALVSDLRGDVLELGCGTGLMFAHYREARVKAVDTDEDFLARARARATSKVDVTRADAEALPFPDASFDAVVSSLVFCSIPHPIRALDEVRRVLRPGGELRMLEHVVSAGVAAAALMRVFDPVWLWLNHQGCHMDRDTVQAVRHVFGEVTTSAFQIFSPGIPTFPMCEIRARG